MVGKIKRPLRRSIFIFMLIFIFTLCLLFGLFTYQILSKSLYQSYNNRMVDVLNYVNSHIDIEDLSECVETNVESEEFTELVAFMDSIMEDFDIHYLYIIRPYKEDGKPYVTSIIAADTAQGRAEAPDGYYLGLLLEDVYRDEEIEILYDALMEDDISFFKNFSKWGYDYTAAMPLINAKGEHFALLCVDIEVEDIYNSIRIYTLLNIILIAALGLIFIIGSNSWMDHNITEPIRKLEKSVVAFAKQGHEQTDPDRLVYDEPDIHTHNEVQTLANSIAQMTVDMRSYVKAIIDARGEMEIMKTHVSHMDMLAYQDALTHVKNKAWYDKIQTRVDEDILSGIARFAIVMADLNNLKRINDNYGHEHGNDYIRGACKEICMIFSHSPVCRIGGDEFVVILENEDFDNRKVLMQKVRRVFEEIAIDNEREPWDKYSVALGVAEFDWTLDTCMNDVFKRADDLMYKDKVASKMGREE